MQYKLIIKWENIWVVTIRHASIRQNGESVNAEFY